MSEVADREKGEDAVEVMDTPEKSKSAQIATPVSKFEESPVFNFLKNLSPIKPIKSAHATQSINPLNFSSLPPIFASPHVASFRDSRFLQRHKLPDPSKPEFSSIGEYEDGVGEINTDTGKEQDGENLNLRMSDAEVAVNPSYNSSMFIVESAQEYDLNNQALADSFALVPLVQEPLQLTTYRSESNMNARFRNDQREEVTHYDWESLIGASDLSIFQSPNASESSKKPVERGTTFYESIENDMIHMQSQCAAMACVEQAGDGNEPENLCTQPGEGNDLPETAENNECYTGPSMNNPGEKIDDEHLPGFYRGTRRRCLVFEMTGARMRHLNEQNSNFDSSTLQEPEGSGGSLMHEQQQPLTHQGIESTRSVLPGIGLHLNAIASTPKDYKIVNQDSSASGRLLIGPNLSVNFRTSSTGQELLNDVLPVPISERDSVEDSVVTSDDAQQAPGYLVNEEGNPSSPRKKRRREQAGEVEACKRCNCKKSKCLKLYCECFAAGVYCVEPCACIDCFNKPIHEDTVLATRKQIESRNPLAFAPKVIRGSDPSSEIGDDSTRTPASARHKRGCNCKKSGCLKKYCECYQGGVGCSINCRCEGCKNAFGRKDGSGVVGVEHDVEEDETDKNQSIDSETPATPVRTIRQSIPQPFSSKNKPPRSSSSLPSMIGSSSAVAAAASSSTNFYTNTGYKNQSFFELPPPKFDKHFEAIRENDEIPDFLLENSPIRGIKSSSPNGKRVSSPHNGGVSPGLRSSRKLILQSIPSFPSLTSNQ